MVVKPFGWPMSATRFKGLNSSGAFFGTCPLPENGEEGGCSPVPMFDGMRGLQGPSEPSQFPSPSPRTRKGTLLTNPRILQPDFPYAKKKKHIPGHQTKDPNGQTP